MLLLSPLPGPLLASKQDLVLKEQYEQSRAQGGPVLPQPITTRPVLGTTGRETPALMWCLRAVSELAAAWPLAQVCVSAFSHVLGGSERAHRTPAQSSQRFLVPRSKGAVLWGVSRWSKKRSRCNNLAYNSGCDG